MNEADRILGEAGIGVEWLRCDPASDAPECQQPGPATLFLRIYGGEPGAGIAQPGAFGFAFTSPAPAFGRLAGILYGRIRECAAHSGLDPALIAGGVIAHEAGHLLLEQSRHSAGGLMKAHWGEEELARLSRAALGFSRAEARRLKDHVRIRHQSVASKGE
jgi:hypothetical protein